MKSRRVVPLAKEEGTLRDDCVILDQFSCIVELHFQMYKC